MEIDASSILCKLELIILLVRGAAAPRRATLQNLITLRTAGSHPVSACKSHAKH